MRATTSDKWTEEDRHNMRARQQEQLNRVTAALDELGVPYFLTSGSLVGAIRDKEFLLDDSDHDIGILAKNWSPEIKAKLDEVLGGYRCCEPRWADKSSKEFSLHQYVAPDKYKRKLVWVDVEIYYPCVIDDERCYFNASWELFKYTSSTMEQELGECVVNGHKYSVLADPSLYLDEVFTSTWSEGRADWGFHEYPNLISRKTQKSIAYEYHSDGSFTQDGVTYQ